MLVMGAGGIFALALPVAVLPSALRGRVTPIAARTQALSPPVVPIDPRSGAAAPASRTIVSRAVVPRVAQRCQAASGPSGYVNPLARAHVRPERIDQGVDYAGSGTLTAIGAARLTYVAKTGTGWPGAFIEYRLLDGPDAGCYVYYAEGLNPVARLHVGETVGAGQRIATIIVGSSTGIELGWGAGIGTMTYAAKTHQWSAKSDANSIASAPGKSFSALIASLGGPSGRMEG
jgi:hypothetical protein